MWYTTLTEWKVKKYIISTDAENAFDKVQHLFMIISLNKIGAEETCPSTISTIYEKPHDK